MFRNPEFGAFNNNDPEKKEEARNPEITPRHVQFLRTDGTWGTLKGENVDVLMHHIKKGRVEAIKMETLSPETKERIEEEGYSLVEDKVGIVEEPVNIYRIEEGSFEK